MKLSVQVSRICQNFFRSGIDLSIMVGKIGQTFCRSGKDW